MLWQWSTVIIYVAWHNQRRAMAQQEGVLADLQIIIYNTLPVFQLCTKASCSFIRQAQCCKHVAEQEGEGDGVKQKKK